MQVDPQAASITVTTPGGGALALDPGKQVVARVLEVSSDGGAAKISLAGQVVAVATDQALTPGQTLSLTVASTEQGKLRFSIDAGSQGAALGDGPAVVGGVSATAVSADVNAVLPSPTVSRQLAEVAPGAIRELARAGVPVTPGLVQVASRAIEALLDGNPALDTATAARSVATLVARDASLSTGAGSRVAAALQLAGQLGSQLGSLAAASPEVAGALPGGVPGAAALRNLLAPQLDPAELAIARIVQALEATHGGDVAGHVSPPASAPPTVITSYVASQVAHAGDLDQLTQSLASRAASTQVDAELIAQRAAQAQVANAQNQAAALAPARGPFAQPLQLPPGALGAATTAADAGAAAAAPPQPSASANASAALQPLASQPATPPDVAKAVAALATAVTRFAPALAQGAGALGDVAAPQLRAMSDVHSQAPAGSFTPDAAGGGSGGAPAPLIAAMREALLGSRGEDAHTLLATLSRFDEQQITAALRQLPEQQSLQLAGKLMQSLPTDGSAAAAQLRAAIHGALGQLGQALGAAGHDQLNALRAALQHVAATDPRPEVQAQATQILHAADGQLLMSQQQVGADPGYVYFQLPLPGHRSAEVIVRRDAGRRAVSFERFDIAFLLNTESLGTLMVHLDAHPAAVTCTVKTDDPAVAPLIERHVDELREPLEREAGRPLTVRTGVFENGTAPTTLLAQPSLGLVPGENAYYA